MAKIHVECLIVMTIGLAIAAVSSAEESIPQGRRKTGSSSCVEVNDRWSREDAKQLLLRWCEALVAYQVKEHPDPCVIGSFPCPACGLAHGRTGDAAYPLLWAYSMTKRKEFLDAAVLAVDWSERMMVRADGGNYNDYRSGWWGITVFSQIAMGKTLLRFGHLLPKDAYGRWMDIFKRQTAFIRRRFMEPSFAEANVNYPAAFCEAMVLASKLTGDAGCLCDAEKTARSIRRLFTADGLLAGEDHPPDAVSPRGRRPIDLAYNCEETIPSLIAYAAETGDRAFENEVLDCAMNHLEFFLPDGGLDDSAGSRSAKWTYYGSRTSDGMLPMLAALAKKSRPGAVRAIDRHLRLLERCTLASGVLAGGIDYAAANEPGCLHHGFTHAKSLAELLMDGNVPETAPVAELPREKARGLSVYPSMGVHLASVGDWRVTFSANDAFSGPESATVGGGSPTLLWHRKAGLLAAGTMSEYSLVEPQNMQDLRHEREVLSATPRFERGKEKSCQDCAVDVVAEEHNGEILYSVRGRWMSAKWTVGEGGIRLTATTDGAGRFVFPVVVRSGDSVRVEGNRALVRKGGVTVALKSNAAISLVKTDRGERAFTPIAGLLTAQFAFPVADRMPFEFFISVE